MNRVRAALCGLLLASGVCFTGAALAAPSLGSHIVLTWNDLGMHCMNQDHDQISILPPYNNLVAQVIRRGDATTLPALVTQGLSLDYSIPGNTYSVGKTNFWDYDVPLFGVDLPPNIGLTGNGLAGVFAEHTGYFEADGIPVTPFTDAAPTVEDPYQQALVIVRDGGGLELTRSWPVIPVSVEVSCVSGGCHGSIQNILDEHEEEGGFHPDNTPILCAECHGSPPLTGPSPGSAGYFSRRIHHKHDFIDQEIPGIEGCYKCHPGVQTDCLRGTMSTDYGMICQDCHGDMEHVSQTIDNGRIPWVEEPACRDCHTAQFGEPVGVLFRNATGHGGVRCTGCHGSPHTIFPSREPRDNAVHIALQG
ncbi:cytochrome c family protein, partial [bacterium]|nr:cytochrome c family protein [bacterium]